MRLMKKIKFNIITLFPDIIRSYLADALLSKAISSGIIEVEIIDLRKFSQNKYNSVDDTIFGGGDGMLLQYRPLALALQSVAVNQTDEEIKAKAQVVYLSPQGTKWNHQRAEAFSEEKEVTLICGRYAGIDQRFIHRYVDQEISIGDYVLSGGELPALTLIESISRFIPGVLGHPQSAGLDSFQSSLLEAPQFSKPQQEDGLHVPEVLLSGNHQKISEWNKMTSLLVTYKKRPDLLQAQNINWNAVKKFYAQMTLKDLIVMDLTDLDFEI